VDAYLTAASATTSLGVLVVGAALPGLLAGSGRRLWVVLLALVGVPLVLLAAYLVPRWLSLPRAQGREVMTPRTDLVAVDEGAALEDIRQVFAQSGYSRIPVYRGTLDEIVGMLHAFDLFKLRPGDPLPVRPVAVTPGSRSCGDLLLDMQRERRHLAVVLDEFGGTLGIATLEDLLEELVGEIFDEHDEEVRSEPAAGPIVFETDGNVPTEAIEERFGVALPEGRSSTVGGRIVEWAGRIPNAGERFLVRGLELDILDASPTRIERLIIRAGGTAAISLPSGSDAA
jgi:putative hemolysin